MTLTLFLPWLLLSLVFFILAILPGYFFPLWLWPDRPLPKIFIIPTAFVASLGLFGLFSLLGQWGQISLGQMLVWWLLLGVLAGAACVWLARRPVQSQPQAGSVDNRPPNFFLLRLAVWLAGGLAVGLFVASRSSWSSGDLWYLQIIQRYIDSDLGQRFNLRASWWILQALLDYASGVQPIDVFSYYLPPLLMVISLLATYALAAQLFHNRNTALLATLLQILFYLSSINSHDWLGRGFFDRIVEDKFLIWLIILPVTLLLTVRYLKSGQNRILLLLAISVSALAFTHPMGLIQGGLSIGAFAAIHLLFNRRRKTVIRLGLIFGVLLLFLAVPLVQRQLQVTAPDQAVSGKDSIETANPTFDYATGIVAVPGRFGLSQTRLWLLSAADDSYLLHPHLIAQPMIVLAILLTPLQLLDLRRSLAAQLLFGNMVIPLLLLYNPVTAPLLGRLITPWLLYRLTYGLPVALVIAYVLSRGLERLQPRETGRPPTKPASIRNPQSTIHNPQSAIRNPQFVIRNPQPALRNSQFAIRNSYYPLLLVTGLALLLSPYIVEGLSFLQERRDRNMSAAERDLLDHLAGQVGPEDVIIAQDDFTTYFIPAFTSARVLYGNAGYAPQARNAVADFYGGQAVTPATLRLLDTWSITALIVERPTPLAFQLAHLPGQFQRLYQNERYALYRRLARTEAAPVIVANGRLRQGAWGKAEGLYRQALAATPADPLAGYGLGQALAGQGQLDQAGAVFRQILAQEPSFSPAATTLAKLLVRQGEPAAAVETLRAALSHWPGDPALHRQAADILLVEGQLDDALGHYQQAVGSQPNAGSRHLALAGLYVQRGLLDQAQAEYETVLALDTWPAIGLQPGALTGVRHPHDFRRQRLAAAWLGLARLHQQADQPAAAEAAYRQAIQIQTGYQPAYQELAVLYRSRDQHDEAVSLLEQAAWRNNNAAWPHLELGQLYLQQVQ